MISVSKIARIIAALAVVLVAAVGFAADEKPAPEAQQPAAAAQNSTVPPSTNPTQRVIYPGEGQGEEQQMADQLECYRWATEQAGWDPYEAYDVLVAKGYAAAQTAEQAQGGLVRGAAIGAAAGGVGGGMRSRRARAAAQAEAEAAIADFEDNLIRWDRNYTACMTGKDYTVN